MDYSQGKTYQIKLDLFSLMRQGVIHKAHNRQPLDLRQIAIYRRFGQELVKSLEQSD